MGAWSHEPFGNDTAADWSYGLEGGKDMAYVESALDAVLGEDDYLDASVAEEAVAAVEVIAKLLGKGTQTDAYTESADIWVASITRPPSAELRAKAIQVIDRITGSESELAELWGEGEDEDTGAWASSMKSLRAAMEI